LLIPLYARARESQQPRPLLVDEQAQTVLARIAYDFERLKVPRKTAVMLCMRSRKLDDSAREFLRGQPHSVVIHLGCGLDGRYGRVDNGQVEWYDVDMPEVIELRRKFYAESERYHLIAAPVSPPEWVAAIDARQRPVLVIAEGVMMYLKEGELRDLILRLKATFPGSELVFDAYSVLTAQNAVRHPALKQTGAVVHWGIDDARAIEQWAEGIRLVSEWYFTQAADLAQLDWGYRLAFWLAGMFPLVRKAHRIVHYRLG